MRLFITGATGFVGRSVVAAALERGHEVTAAIRPSTSASSLGEAADHPSLSFAHLDLRSPAGLDGALAGVDTVIHLAAAKSGDFYEQFAGTVVATENLLGAMTAAGVGSLVGVSTFSVYDYQALRSGEVLTEESPIDLTPSKRDEYARTKLVQEGLYRDFGAASDHRLVICRPGMIYGPDNLWHALLGASLGPRFLRIGTKATLPMTYVENCSEALLRAAERLADSPSELHGQVINIVDDDLPTQASYVDAVSKVIEPPPSVTVPWPVMRLAADALAVANNTFVDGRAKFPGIVVPERLHGRFKPLRYTNDKAKRLLGWEPRYDFAEALRRSVEAEDRLQHETNGSAALHG